MRRRDFIKKTALAGVAAPFAAWAVVRGASSPEQLIVESPKHPDLCVPVNGHRRSFGRVFHDGGEQAAYLRQWFARAEHWMESTDYKGHWKGVCTPTVSPGTRSTYIHGVGASCIVDTGAYIEATEQSDWLYISQKAPSGRDLNWYWRPATKEEVARSLGSDLHPGVMMGIDQIYRPKPGKSMHFRIEGSNFVVSDTCEWDYADTLMRRYQVDICVVDQYPELYFAQKFADRYPGHVLLASHVQPGASGRPLVVTLNPRRQTVQIPVREYSGEFLGSPESCAQAYCDVARDLWHGKFMCRVGGGGQPYRFDHLPWLFNYQKRMRAESQRRL